MPIRYLLICALLFPGSVALPGYGNPIAGGIPPVPGRHASALSVKDFGAKGDGKSDDAVAVNLALAAAHIQNRDVYFPAGTYLCNTLNTSKMILTFDAGKTNGITLYGDGKNSIITTSLNGGSTLLYFWSYSKVSGLTVKDLSFGNTHGLTKENTSGIFIQGLKEQNFSNVLISGCHFEGFGVALGGQGMNGLTITNNTFGAPKGHDNAKTNTEPAVFCWFYDNANGYCTNIKINDNTADGYTGAAPLSTLFSKRPMDGFIYGTGYGFTITGNTTRNFSEEHYALAPPTTMPNTDATVLISGNHLDASLPPGAKNDDGTGHTGNYGIRCDISNATITDNDIHNFTNGIMVRGIDHPGVDFHTFEISGNKLYAATDTTNYDVHAGIYLQGNVSQRIHNITVHDNEITLGALRNPKSYTAVRLYDMQRGIIQKNNIHMPANTAPAGNGSSITYGRVEDVKDSSNLIKN